MPSMLRIPGKPKDIAERILGQKKQRSKKKRSKIDQRLNFEETVRVR